MRDEARGRHAYHRAAGKVRERGSFLHILVEIHRDIHDRPVTSVVTPTSSSRSLERWRGTVDAPGTGRGRRQPFQFPPGRSPQASDAAIPTRHEPTERPYWVPVPLTCNNRSGQQNDAPCHDAACSPTPCSEPGRPSPNGSITITDYVHQLELQFSFYTARESFNDKLIRSTRPPASGEAVCSATDPIPFCAI
jgi:hypothetical protein